jgi:hypothetical protein
MASWKTPILCEWRSPIFKDRFFLKYGNILGNGVKQNV